MSPKRGLFGIAAAVWGLIGCCLLLGSALWRLTPLALAPLLDGSLGGVAAAAYVGFILFNAWAEGYRGFQRRYSPMVAARACYLSHHPRPLQALLAPFFCTGLLWATRRRLVVAWTMLLGVATLVAIVKQLPQPWRGVVDGGVVVGLAWGLIATLVFAIPALVRGVPPPVEAYVVDPRPVPAQQPVA